MFKWITFLIFMRTTAPIRTYLRAFHCWMQPEIKIIFAGCRLIAIILNAKHRQCVTHLSDCFGTCEWNDKWATGRHIVQVHQHWPPPPPFLSPEIRISDGIKYQKRTIWRIKWTIVDLFIFVTQCHNKDNTYLLSSEAYADDGTLNVFKGLVHLLECKSSANL